MDTKDKLVEKLKEYIKYLIHYPHLTFKMDKFESEIAALEKQVKEQESKEDQYRKFMIKLGTRLIAGRDFLMTQDSKYLIIEDCLEAFGFTRDGLNEIV